MEFLLRNIENKEFFTYLILGALAVLTSTKLIYQNQFNEFIALLKNGKYLILHNKKTTKATFFNSLFYLFFTINFTLFSFLILQHVDKHSIQLSFLNLFVMINVFFLSKYLIEKIVFETLDLNAFFEGLNFQKLTYINVNSLFLFILNIIFLYIIPNPSNSSLYISLGLIISLYLISIGLIIIFNRDLFLKYWFYFILYLCAFEISPILIGGFLLTK